MVPTARGQQERDTVMRVKKRAISIAGLFGLLPCLFFLCGSAHGMPEVPLEITSPSALLMDGITGHILFQKNPAKRFSPASLVKMMTLCLAFDAIKRGSATLDEEVVVSEKAWKMGGSQMFLEVGDRVTLAELIQGVAVVSANDGALAIAEFLAGSEEVFVQQMNEKARVLGLKQTRFANSHGLHAEGQETSAMDMTTLGFRYLTEHPDALKFHILPEYTYGGIRQPNRNPLLDRDMGVDGLRTGYLKRSGYHFLFSATKDAQRLVGAVMGANTAESRDRDALELLRYGFKNFSTVTVVKEGDLVGKVNVQRGDPPELDLSAAETLVVTIGKGIEESIRLRKEIPSSVTPPVTKGAVLGKLFLEAEGLPTKQIDLIASRDAQARSYALYSLITLTAVLGLIGYLFWKRRRLREGRFPRRWS